MSTYGLGVGRLQVKFLQDVVVVPEIPVLLSEDVDWDRQET